MHELYGCRGCGSAVVEACLAIAGVPFGFHEVEPWKPGPAADALRAINPLAQVPTLVLPGGTVMTESAAMIVWLDESYPAAALLPAPGSEARAQALRWIGFIAGNMYAAIGVRDFPERWVPGEAAQSALKNGATERLKAYWSTLEASLTATPFLAGPRMSALDLYAAMLSRWATLRAWVEGNCPRTMSAIRLTEADPRIAAVWSRNFFED